MEITVSEINPKEISGTVFILGNNPNIIKKIINSSPFNGVVCAKDKNSYKELPLSKVYNRYSSLLCSRCFHDNTYLVIDNCSVHQLNEIKTKSENKMMLLVYSFEEYIDMEYDYIFICNKNIKKIYKKYIEPKMSYKEFSQLVDQENDLIINCKSDNIEDLFLAF